MRLVGKTALITGAARRRGIGRGVALALAKEGADILINDVDAMDEAEELREIIRQLGRKAEIFRADVSVRSEVNDMFRFLERTFGGIDILVNNAGVASWENVTDITEETYRRIMGVNVKGAFNCCQEAARLMIRQGRGGRIVIISSVHAQMPFGGMAAYGASKAALRELANALALELAPHGINVNHIGPGWVDSDINRNSPDLQTEEDRRRTMGMIPCARPADPENDLGRGVVYLVTGDGDYVTGTYLRIDGGFVTGKFYDSAYRGV